MAKFDKSRQKVFQIDRIVDRDLSEVTLGEITLRLMALQRKHGEDATFELDVDSGYCHADVAIEIRSSRPETQEEYDERYRVHLELERQKRSTAKQRRLEREEQDRVEFERLKKKFKSK